MTIVRSSRFQDPSLNSDYFSTLYGLPSQLPAVRHDLSFPQEGRGTRGVQIITIPPRGQNKQT
jgi:hypothetical protein